MTYQRSSAASASTGQPADQDLTDIAALTPSNDDLLQRKSGAWTSRTPAQVKTDLTLAKVDVGLGNVDDTSDANKPVSTATSTALATKQPLDSDLTDIAALAPAADDLLQRKSGAWTSRTPAQVKTDMGIASFGLGWFGDGSDGAVDMDGTNTFAAFASKSGNTYTLTRPVFATTLTVGSGVTLNAKGFIIYASVGASGAGTISFNGSAATSATGGFAAIPSGRLNGGTAGGNGGTAAGSAGTNNSVQAVSGIGGAGGAGASGAGGAAGTQGGLSATDATAVQPRMLPAATVGVFLASTTAVVLGGSSGGGGGGGDSTNSGGGGGGSAGTVIVNAKALTGTLTVSANGGAGFTPTAGNAGGGGGGGGGLVIVNTTSGTATLTATGGSAGSGVGSGAAGSPGTVGKTFLNVWA